MCGAHRTVGVNMRQIRNVIISFDAGVFLEKRDTGWAAYIEPLGMTVYGATQSDAQDRFMQAINFFLKHFGSVEQIRAYLDAHGVRNSLTVDDENISPVRRTYPIVFPIGEAVSA